MDVGRPAVVWCGLPCSWCREVLESCGSCTDGPALRVCEHVCGCTGCMHALLLHAPGKHRPCLPLDSPWPASCRHGIDPSSTGNACRALSYGIGRGANMWGCVALCGSADFCAGSFAKCSCSLVCWQEAMRVCFRSTSSLRLLFSFSFDKVLVMGSRSLFFLLKWLRGALGMSSRDG